VKNKYYSESKVKKLHEKLDEALQSNSGCMIVMFNKDEMEINDSFNKMTLKEYNSVMLSTRDEAVRMNMLKSKDEGMEMFNMFMPGAAYLENENEKES